MKEIIKKIDAAVRVLNNIEVKQKQNLLNMGGVIDLLESVIVDLQKMDIEATLKEKKKNNIYPQEVVQWLFGVIISSMMGYHVRSLA